MDEKYFPNATLFDPQRWLGEASTVRGLSSAKRVSMPFGTGPRACPGRYLAMLEIKMAIAMLLSRFELESVDTPGDGEPQELMAFTMAPMGLRMKLHERH